MNMDEELEILEATDKMVRLKRARQNVKIAIEIGISEEDAKELFYKDIIEDKEE